MADMLTNRPPGEVMCHIERPIYRFGLTLSMAVRAHDGQVYYATLEPREGFTSGVMWRLYRPGEQPPPLMYLDEEMVAAMLGAMNNEPPKVKGNHVHEHLADAMAMRDRLLTMVEKSHNALVTPQTAVFHGGGMGP